MKATATALMIVLTAPNGCKIDNIDRAEATVFPMASMEECETQAEKLDAEYGVRALCIPDN
ncbi:hypothetical protein [Leisingera sp. F5]|uniref:hypothetical protein n=1 Tax=Leisingera sp. F5 TaxID=1813816 RepID=UPI000ADE8F6B|nr:hypothetical protein [Leisingera sp. F5]